MSLQLAAQHLASRGRGPDTTLVHMAPQEVAGLQALAKAHGGTLTVNPDTGLPEAGFLSSILPMVAGAFLGPAGLGLTAMQAGLAGAALGTVATGSLQKGLMAGLGAYGGAGLAGGLMGAGAAAAPGVYVGGLEGVGVGSAQGLNAMDVMSDVATQGLGSAAPTAGVGVGSSQGINAMDAMSDAAFRTAPAVSPVNADLAVKNAVPTVTKAPTFMENISQMGRGIQNLGTEAGREAFMGQAASKGVEATGVGGMKGLMQYGLAGLAPVAMDMMTPKQREMAKQEELKAKNYRFAYNPVANPQQEYTGAYTGERTYFNPTYTPIAAAGGGLMDIGPVEAMSRSNRSQMAPAYARGGVSDTAVNPYTGAETFAEGGDTKAARPVEQDPYYTMSGQSGDAFKYLMGQMPVTSRAPAPVYAPVRSTVQAASNAFSEPTSSDIGGFDVSGFGGLGLFGRGRSGAGGATSERDSFGRTYEESLKAAPTTPAPEQQSPTNPFARFLNRGAAAEPAAPTGEWVDVAATNEYVFDPNTGTFATAAPRKMWRTFETATPEPVAQIDPWANMSSGFAHGGIASLAQGGQSHLGDYSDGGRLLRGPGDGVSDSIPASIGDKRPARLADGEFVVPARIVSELGNGSTEAGARKLYAMMDRVQKARAKTTGKDRVATNTKAEKLLPA